MYDKRIRTVEELRAAAHFRRSVILSGRRKPTPAAFIMNWSACAVLHFIDNGVFYYKPEHKHTRYCVPGGMCGEEGRFDGIRIVEYKRRKRGTVDF